MKVSYRNLDVILLQYYWMKGFFQKLGWMIFIEAWMEGFSLKLWWKVSPRNSNGRLLSRYPDIFREAFSKSSTMLLWELEKPRLGCLIFFRMLRKASSGSLGKLLPKPWASSISLDGKLFPEVGWMASSRSCVKGFCQLFCRKASLRTKVSS